MGATNRTKAGKRFYQLNHLVDHVGPHLPGVSHLAVLLVCFRHAHASKFSVSVARIANSTRLSKRHVKRILRELESIGTIIMLNEHRGPIPRLYRITGRVNLKIESSTAGRTASRPSGQRKCTSVRGDTHVTITSAICHH